MSSRERRHTNMGFRGKVDESIEIEEVDVDTLLNKAEAYWGEKNWDVSDDETRFVQFEDENAIYDISAVPKYDEVNVQLTYDFNSSERNCSANMDDLWDLYVEPVVKMSTVENYD